MKKLLAALSVMTALSASPVLAESLDPLIEGAKLCTRHLPRYEREFGIPTHLLSAIASTESGRYHQGLGIRIPWPWTINAEGKGYYFDSRQQAVAAAQKLRLQGVRSMDIGCMQVNMMHHPNAFASIEEAFEPQKNIAYAAGFLRGLYEENKSWKNAASDYHSKTPARGQSYVGLVYNSWYQIIDKLRAAKMQVPESSVAALAALKAPGEPASAPTTQVKSIKFTQPARQVALLPEQEGKKLSAYKSPRMNSIRMSSRESSNENGIIVVRPEIKVVDAPVPAMAKAPDILPPALTLADAKPQMSAPAAGARIIRVDGENTVKTSTVRSGPNFIFQ